MWEQTPSQAEGERDDDEQNATPGKRLPATEKHPDVPRTTPSQAEGEVDESG